MNYLSEHNTGTDTDIQIMQAFIGVQPEEHREFYKGMITKSLKLGCDIKTANAAIPHLIFSWDIQQAYPLSEKNAPKKGEQFFLSQKLNGTNAGYLDGKLISRQGKPFKGLSHIIDEIQMLPFKDMFFNGELIHKNPDNLSDNDNFQRGTGIINSDEGVDKSDIKFVIYEMFPKEEFFNGESKLGYGNRRIKYLNPLINAINNLNLTNLEVVPIIYEGTDTAVIDDLLLEADNKGWEGLMLNKDTTWKNKRNNGILKVKSFKNADIICTDVVEGEGRLTGTLGLIECDYKGNKLGVGSGFTDEQRQYYWNNPNEIVGKIVQIKYKQETQNKHGGVSVQFPTFICVRSDKTEPSYEG